MHKFGINTIKYIYIYHLKIYLYKDLFDLDMIFVWDKSAPPYVGSRSWWLMCWLSLILHVYTCYTIVAET